jgi:hypothetical protein
MELVPLPLKTTFDKAPELTLVLFYLTPFIQVGNLISEPIPEIKTL